ncbi:sporulation peptidase YabG [Tannockella kyphosi]|uniref:sporulation peptidase YabG n=1 Tax=Tannockella kyphosi TaxID=2899121 RepID=UPI0020131626|nr:sporulation peptidase YabG [Tannockella kyphosi]
MKIGDIVCRKKYGKDICFEIEAIQEDIYYLRGIEYRLIADSTLEDLELSEFNPQDNDIEIEQNPQIKGTVLHIDGDNRYLELCLNKYKEFRVHAYGYHIPENQVKDRILELLKKHKPDLLVITGHDALKKSGNRKDSSSYLHSLDYVEAIKVARSYEGNKDHLIIFAGACQSYYELLLASGANFASSPDRKNIHALDPVYVVSQIAGASVTNYVDLEKIVAKTSKKHQGIGGIDTRGVARKIYPISR